MNSLIQKIKNMLSMKELKVNENKSVDENYTFRTT